TVTASTPTPPAPSPHATVVFGGDLSAEQRTDVGQTLSADPSAPVQTLSRAALLSTLTQAGLDAAPSDAALSSVALACQSGSGALTVRAERVDGRAPVTYAPALLVAGARAATVTVAGPSDQTVSGESALVGALQALTGCMSGQPPANVDAALKLIRLTDQ